MLDSLRCAFLALLSVASIASAAAIPMRQDVYGDPLPPGAVARLGTVRLRMDEPVAALAFSPDNRLLASSDTDGNIVIWQTATGKEMKRFDRLIPSAGLAFSHDNRRLVAANDRGDAACWDVATGKRAWSRSGGGGGSIPAFTAFLPGDKELVIYNRRMIEGEGRLIDSATGRDIRKVIDSSGIIYEAMALSWDGRRLARGNERRVRIFQSRSGKLVREIAFDSREEGNSIALAVNAMTLAIGRPGQIDLYDIATGKRSATLKAPVKGVHTLQFSRAGDILVSVGADNELRLWNLVRKSSRAVGEGHCGRIVAFAGDGSRVAIGSLKKISLKFGKQQDCRVRGSPSGILVFHDQSDGVLLVVEARTGKVISRIFLSGRIITALAISPNGRFLATAERAESTLASDGGLVKTRASSIRLWDCTDESEVRCFSGHDSTVRDLAFSPDGRHLASALNNGAVVVWNVARSAGQAARQIKEGELTHLWSGLADSDATTAYQAMAVLADQQDRAGTLLRNRLSPVPAREYRWCREMLVALDSDSFEERERATKLLSERRPQVDFFLRQALTNKPSLDVYLRLRKILAGEVEEPASMNQKLRAIQVLEWIATPQSRQWLHALARGAPEAPETIAA